MASCNSFWRDRDHLFFQMATDTSAGKELLMRHTSPDRDALKVGKTIKVSRGDRREHVREKNRATEPGRT